MDKKFKLLEYTAKKLLGKKVKITLKKKETKQFPGIKFPSYSIIVKLNQIEDGFMHYTKETGMVYSLCLKDEYFEVEKIEEYAG